MSPLDVFREFPCLSVRELHITSDAVRIAADSTARTAACPGCGCPTARVHSRYGRTLADLPWQGRRVVVRVTARRFRCPTAGCPRAVFCEPMAVAARHARTTARLAGTHRAIGFAAGGEAGSRLARRLAMPTSPDTLLRRVKATPPSARATPRALGVDDFAFRKGARYGTILVDLERRCVVDLLPDRTADAVAAWLRRHPGVEVVSRDRASAYAQAAAAAAPTATQVADRFHLLANVREAVERVLTRHAGAVRDALTDPPATPPAAAPATDPEPPYRRREREAVEGRRAARRARYERARALREQGYSVRRIARALRMSPGSILRYLRTGHVADWRPGRTAPSRLDPYRAYIDARLAAGCRNARVLHREFQERGYAGGYDQVCRAVRRRTGVSGRLRLSGPVAVPAADIPSPRRLSFLVARRPDRRAEGERAQVTRLRAAGSTVGAAVDLGERFAALVRDRSAGGLDGWLAAAAASEVPEFRGLARSMGQDLAAVRAGGGGGVVERPGGGPGEPAEVHQAGRLRPRWVRLAEGTGAARRVAG